MGCMIETCHSERECYGKCKCCGFEEGEAAVRRSYRETYGLTPFLGSDGVWRKKMVFSWLKYEEDRCGD